MSSVDARVMARAVLPGDRAAWDKLFQEYREFYKLPFDAAVRVFAFFGFANIFHSLKFVAAESNVPSRFTTQFGIGCFHRLLYLSTFLTLAVWLHAMQDLEP
jgi:hypothetical protein